MSYISDEILYSVEKPARYTGGELNAVIKDKNSVDVRFAFCFADTYEIGMSHQGMKLLYDILNSHENIWCERVFAPWVDLEKIMREKGLKLFALESQEPVDVFDFMGFTLQYEMSYTTVISMITLAGLPAYAKDRTEGMPIVIGGGPAAMNPEPIADFFDLFNLGDGEEMLPEILNLYAECKKAGLKKADFLKKAAEIEGVYVPSFYEPVYDDNGEFSELKVKDEYKGIAKEKIVKRVIKDLANAPVMHSQVVPYVEAIHDRVMLEVSRGCIRGCRFCQAGFIYRPMREKDYGNLLTQAKELSENTGYEELSLLSLSTSDYSCLKQLTDGLIDYTDARKMNIGLPSLRIDSFSIDLMNKISKVRKSGLTFAPEAGTQRLRDVINKGITEEDIMSSARLAFEGGYTNVKLYFMIGLPTETDEDIIGIGDLAHKIRGLYFEVHRGEKVKAPTITVSVSTFVPKAFTPFQWCRQISYEEIYRKQKLVKETLGLKIGFKWQDPEISVCENILARGDRRCSELLYNVYLRTGGFDAWNNFFDFNVWMEEKEKLGKCGYDGCDDDSDLDKNLPWDYVDIGVTKKFMQGEFKKAYEEKITPNCREKCAGCGAARYCGGVCVEQR